MSGVYACGGRVDSNNNMVRKNSRQALPPFLESSDDVASRLQVSDLYKSDLQVSSRFANDLYEI